MIKCVEINAGSGTLILPAKDLIEGLKTVVGENLTESLEIGDRVTVDVTEKTQAELDVLPEFNG